MSQSRLGDLERQHFLWAQSRDRAFTRFLCVVGCPAAGISDPPFSQLRTGHRASAPFLSLPKGQEVLRCARQFLVSF